MSYSKNRNNMTRTRQDLASRFGKRSRKIHFNKRNNPDSLVMRNYDINNKPENYEHNLKCSPPYYDTDTRHLKNKYDLSDVIEHYKNTPVGDWELDEKRQMPCNKESDYVRLVDDIFCCETAENRKKNPLEADYDNKIKQRKQDYADLYNASAGPSEASKRRNAIEITEEIYQDLLLPAAPYYFQIFEDGKPHIYNKAQLIRSKEYFIGKLLNISSMSSVSKDTVKFRARPTLEAPNNRKTIRKKTRSRIREPRGSYKSKPGLREAFSIRAQEVAQQNAAELHKELLANNAKEQQEIERLKLQCNDAKDKGFCLSSLFNFLKSAKSKKPQSVSRVIGRKPSIKRKGKGKVSSKRKGKGKGSAKEKGKGKEEKAKGKEKAKGSAKEKAKGKKATSKGKSKKVHLKRKKKV